MRESAIYKHKHLLVRHIFVAPSRQISQITVNITLRTVRHMIMMVVFTGTPPHIIVVICALQELILAINIVSTP